MGKRRTRFRTPVLSGLPVRFGLSVLGMAAVLGAALPADRPDPASGPSPSGAQAGDFQVPPPPLTEGIFPCSQCHNKDMPPNRQRRKLADMHDDIVLHHDEEHRWCLDCHDADNRDKLHLVGGQLIDFSQSYLLCGQCHGDKLRDWKVGVHGKRTGSWNGNKQYLLCIHCHNPHSPRFKPLKPLPPPDRPGAAAPEKETPHAP